MLLSCRGTGVGLQSLQLSHHPACKQEARSPSPAGIPRLSGQFSKSLLLFKRRGAILDVTALVLGFSP